MQNNKMKYVINGRFLTQRMTGTQRFSKEVTGCIDKISKGEICIAIPRRAKGEVKLQEYSNLKVFFIGKLTGNLWDQISLPRFAKDNGLEIISLNNNVPVMMPGIAAIHDLTYVVHKEWHTTTYGRLSAYLHSWQFHVAGKKSRLVITSSETSKKDIIKYYRTTPSKIVVMGDGWEHLADIAPDYSILDKFLLNDKEYIFTLGSIEKNKNIKWIYETAKRNRKYVFVISGGTARNHREELNPENLENIVFTGYISDEQVAALYKKCKAFAFPSVYEGFGIPPLEALYYGCEVMCADSSCLPEIYGNTVHWFDPYNYDVQIDGILSSKVESAGKVLEKYTWKNMAYILYSRL